MKLEETCLPVFSNRIHHLPRKFEPMQNKRTRLGGLTETNDSLPYLPSERIRFPSGKTSSSRGRPGPSPPPSFCFEPTSSNAYLRRSAPKLRKPRFASQDRCPRRRNDSSIASSNQLRFFKRAHRIPRTDLEHVRSLLFSFSFFFFLFSIHLPSSLPRR